MLSESSIRQAGYFHPDRVAMLVRKAESNPRFSELDNMALVGVLSTQWIYRQFVEDAITGSESLWPDVVVDRRSKVPVNESVCQKL